MPPWNESDVEHKTSLARTPTARRQWVDIANEVLHKTGDEGRAIREANGVIHRRSILGGTRIYHDADDIPDGE